jgi:hypothetical protein
MTLKDIAITRLVNLQIVCTKFKTVMEIVNWMGAMQAQDLPMSKWAVGIRLPGSVEKVINDAIDNAEIIRTHLMRPTWHLVSSEDIYWMLELTAPQIKSSLKSRHKELELTPDTVNKSNTIIEKALLKKHHLTRQEIIAHLHKAKISTNDNRASHLLLCAELEEIICSGKIVKNKQTYALLNERVKKIKNISRDEALTKLAVKYFSGHSPATLDDFSWWSGLHAKDARQALESAEPDLIKKKINSVEYYLMDKSFPVKIFKDVHLLPAYDEFLISYKDRSASLAAPNNKRTISMNGIFKPVVVINGEVKGTWKRTNKKDDINIEVELFADQDKSTKNLILEAADKYGFFMSKKTETKFYY